MKEPQKSSTIVDGPAQHRIASLQHGQDGHGFLFTENTPVTAGPKVPVFILCDTFIAGEGMFAWWEREETFWYRYEEILPRLKLSSNGMLLGFSETDDREARDEIRETMDSLIGPLQSHAASVAGKDFSINGLELPASYDPDLLVRRLRHYALSAGRGASLANGITVPFEEITHQSINQAITIHVL